MLKAHFALQKKEVSGVTVSINTEKNSGFSQLNEYSLFFARKK